MRNDDAYDNQSYIPGAAEFVEMWEERSEEWRRMEGSLGRARLNHAYGDGAREAFDLYLPAGRPEGLMVFFHGGYWRRFDRRDFAHLAAGATARGWAAALPSYTLAPEARIATMGAQAAAAVAEAARLVAGPIVLCGHSAGGQLVARLEARDSALPADVAARLRHMMPISPLSDLAPLIETSMNADLKLDEEEARTESPALLTPRGTPVTVWVGAEERPAFLDQARLLADAWPQARLHVAPGRHHFDVIAPLEDPESDLVAALLDPPAV